MDNKRIIELPKALVEGFVLDKECKSQGSSAAIYLPKGTIGQRFKVILLPVRDDLEAYVRANHPEIVKEYLNSKEKVDTQQSKELACQDEGESTGSGSRISEDVENGKPTQYPSAEEENELNIFVKETKDSDFKTANEMEKEDEN